MALPNLSGSYIQDTYQRIVQYDGGGNFYDGTGSLLNSVFPGNTNRIDQNYINPTLSGSITIKSGIIAPDKGTIVYFSSSVSASTYYGDGSNLTGISTDPFPYTGSAVITGSLEVIGDVTGDKFIIDGVDYNYLNTRIKLGYNNTGISLTTTDEIHLIGNNTGVLMIKGAVYKPEVRLKSSTVFGFSTANINGSLGVHFSRLDNETIRIGTGGTWNNSGSLLLTNLTASGHVSASTYYGDGSNLSGISSTPFPFEGDAIITGSLTVSGSVVDFTSASAVNINLESLSLVNPIVEYLDVTASISSGTSITLPNNLSYVSSSVYEYLEIFMNGLRLRYNRDFVPTSNTTIQNQMHFPSGSELTFKSLKR